MTPDQQDAGERRGILITATAYVIWGLMPLYWQLLPGVPAFQITIHRIFWCAVFVFFIVLARGRLSRLVTLITSPRVLGWLALTSLLISVNWTLYIWAVVQHRIVAASLGYYLTPLVSMVLGIFLLREKVSTVRMVAMGLASLAVAGKAVESGEFPWIGLALAISFGFYGFIRKKIEVAALEGLAIESGLLFIPSLALLIYWHGTGESAFLHGSALRDLLLILAGPATAVPLAMFAMGAQLVRLTTLGFLQYIAPGLSLILATAFLGEVFTFADGMTFGLVWFALLLVAFESRLKRIFKVR